MEPDKDRRRAAAAIRSKIDLKHFLRDHEGLTLAEVRDVMDAVFSPDRVYKEDGTPLTKAGIARKARDYRELQRQKHALLYSLVRDDAMAKARTYDGPMPATNAWVKVPGEKEEDLLTPYEQLRHAIADEMAKSLSAELDACANDDELESLLIAKQWDVDTIEHYIETFGKGQVASETRSG